MTEEQKKDYLYFLFIITVIMLAVLYFTVPERSMIIENQMQWWKEFKETFLGFLS
ncbi:MAG: hypothetical protein JSV11_06350 [Nitrospiraceae bacterium]|nr:MAG: hypothetical protein JSV11_06350 [Nitrospiraceae bacterium]